MKPYKIWMQKDNERELLIEVFNDCDVLEVQKEFTGNGYILISCQQCFCHTFILAVKAEW